MTHINAQRLYDMQDMASTIDKTPVISDENNTVSGASVKNVTFHVLTTAAGKPLMLTPRADNLEFANHYIELREMFTELLAAYQAELEAK